MTRIKNLFLAVLSDQSGGEVLEYALIAGIIVATMVIGFTALTNALSNQFSNIGASL